MTTFWFPRSTRNVGDLLTETRALGDRQQVILALGFRPHNQRFVVKALGSPQHRPGDVD
ncbi:MAG: hypothetical protein WA753_05970 [Pseudolabrys sp.]